MNKRLVFLSILFVSVLLVYVLRGIITSFIYSEYHYSRETILMYLPPVLSAILIALTLCISFDLYFAFFIKRLIKNHVLWIKSVLINYTVFTTIMIGLYTIYSYTVYVVTKYYKHIMLDPSRFPAIFSSLIILLALTYIGIASVKYILLYRNELGRYSMWKRLVKILSIFWDHKGTFLIWLLTGFLIVGLIGFIAEFLATALPSTFWSFHGIITILIISFINSTMLYFYYTYFVENYIQDVIMDLGYRNIND